MEYNNETVRRQDRLLDRTRALYLLKNGEYGVLSMQAEEGGGYGIPVNFVWDGNSAVYIHCAPEGRKLHCIDRCPAVSLCIVGNTEVIPDKFTTGYESIVLFCNARTGLETGERMHALELILDKYSPDDKETGMKYAEKSFRRTEIIRLDIIRLSGKGKKVPGTVPLLSPAEKP